VSENIGDFSSIADVADQRGDAHFGLVLIDPAKFPPGKKATIGRLVVELERLLKIHPGDGAMSLRHWL